jgi:hypothetical protein
MARANRASAIEPQFFVNAAVPTMFRMPVEKSWMWYPTPARSALAPAKKPCTKLLQPEQIGVAVTPADREKLLPLLHELEPTTA